MADPKQHKNSFMREALSEHGVASSKRIFGAFCLLVCMSCMVYLTVTEGGTKAVENIIQTMIIVACTLLGLGSITNTASAIFSKKEKSADYSKNQNVEDAEE